MAQAPCRFSDVKQRFYWIKCSKQSSSTRKKFLSRLCQQTRNSVDYASPKPNIFLLYKNSSHVQQKHHQKSNRPGEDRTVTSVHREQAHSARIWKISHEEHTSLILHLCDRPEKKFARIFLWFLHQKLQTKTLGVFSFYLNNVSECVNYVQSISQ